MSHNLQYEFVPVTQETVDALPSNAHRVQVLMVNGLVKFKQLHELVDTDKLCFLHGKPVIMKRPPGRPKKNVVSLAPVPPLGSSAPVVAGIKSLSFQKRQEVSTSPLVQIATRSPYSDDMIAQIMREHAEEVASIKYERQRAEERGVDTSQISIRRIAALKIIADHWFQRREQLTNKIDLASPGFVRIFTFLLHTFAECMGEQGIDDTVIENVKMELSKKLQDPGWEAAAKEAMRG